MRILAITNLYPSPLEPNRSTFNRLQFRAIAAEHPMTVIAPIAWTDERAAMKKGATWPNKSRRSQRDGIEVYHPRYLFPPRVMRGFYGHFFQRSIRKTFSLAVERFKPDVVLGSWAYPDGWAAVRLAKAAGLPVVLKVHGSDVLQQSSYPARQRRTQEALQNADGIIAVSNDLANRVTQLGVPADRVKVVYNGIDPDVFCRGSKATARASVGIDPTEKLLLFVGNLVPVKGADVLLEACGQLMRGGTAFRCVLIGQGAGFASLQKQMFSLGLESRVTFTGPKPQSELPDWFRAADLLVLPSRSEGVPNVLLECSACGAPYVASNVGGVAEIAHLGNGKLVPPENPEALAAAIADRLLINEDADAARAGPSRRHADSAAEVCAFLQQIITAHPETVAIR